MSRRWFGCARTLLVMLAVLALPVSPAFAQDQQQPFPFDDLLPMPDMSDLRMTPAQARTPEEFFAVFDADGNGCIDRSEWRRRIMAIFFALDTEGTTQPVVIGARGDEELTRNEVPNLSQRAFDQADLDKNGKISAYEFNQAPWTRYEAANPGIADCLDLAMFTRFLRTLRD